jgi:hypothetical protein
LSGGVWQLPLTETERNSSAQSEKKKNEKFKKKTF